MASLKQKLKSLHRRNSKRHALLLFLVLLVFLGISGVARYYALVPLRLMDSSMTPGFREQSVVWMCKLPICLNDFNEGDIVWASFRGNDRMVRKVLALPGDSIQINDKGQVVTPRGKFTWKQEDSFIQSRSFYVPKAGDTLQFNELNDVEQDYIISYLRDKGQHIIVKTTLWQGEHEINIDRVGSTKIANRQVSLNEVDFLPWQDRFLIETQIRQSEPGNAPITLRREIFRGMKKEIPASQPVPVVLPAEDSTTTPAESTSVNPANIDSTASATAVTGPAEKPSDTSIETKMVDVISEPIQSIVVEDDCYYLVCNKGSNCPDSRETGYITANNIYGRYVEWPTRVDNAVITPASQYIHSGINFISDLFSSIADSISGFFSSDEEESSKEEKADDKKKPSPEKKVRKHKAKTNQE